MSPLIAIAAIAVGSTKKWICDSGAAKRLQNALIRLRRLRVFGEGRLVVIRL